MYNNLANNEYSINIKCYYVLLCYLVLKEAFLFGTLYSVSKYWWSFCFVFLSFYLFIMFLFVCLFFMSVSPVDYEIHEGKVNYISFTTISLVPNTVFGKYYGFTTYVLKWISQSVLIFVNFSVPRGKYHALFIPHST